MRGKGLHEEEKCFKGGVFGRARYVFWWERRRIKRMSGKGSRHIGNMALVVDGTLYWLLVRHL